MMTIWLMLLPFGMGLLLWFLRRARLLSILLAACAAVAMAIIAPMAAEQDAFTVLGRSLVLNEQIVLPLVAQFLLVALVLIHSWGSGRRDFSAAAVLFAMGGTVGFVAIENLSIAGLVLGAGFLASAAVMAEGRNGYIWDVPGRMVVIVTLAVICIELAALSYEPSIGNVEPLLSQPVAAACLAVGIALLLAAVPFHVWLPPLFRRGNPAAVMSFGLLLPLGMCLRLEALSLWVGPVGRRVMMATLTWGGMGSIALGAVAAMLQRDLRAASGYLALEDGGFLILTMGLAGQASTTLMSELLLWHMLAVSTLTMGMTTLMGCDVELSLSGLKGIARRAPMSSLCVALGLMTLAGLPVGGGFAPRIELLRELARQSGGLAMLLTPLGLLGIAYVGRFIVAVCRPLPRAGAERERTMGAVLTILPAVALLLGGLVPFLLPILVGT